MDVAQSLVENPMLDKSDGVVEWPLTSLDEACFDRLVKRFQPDLLRFACRIAGNETDAKEIIQTIWMRIWAKREKVEKYALTEKGMWSYLCPAVRRENRDLIKGRVGLQKALGKKDEIEAELGANTQATPEQIVGRIELVGQAQDEDSDLNEGIDSLDIRMLELADMGYTHKEIAKELGISETKVPNRMQRARDKRREKKKDVT